MKISKAVQAQLDRNPSNLTDAQRIARLEVFEADHRANLTHPVGSFRTEAKFQLDVLAALRARVQS